MGIALTAAALSITVGVLVGAVITIGSHARSQSAVPSSDAQVSAAQSSFEQTLDVAPQSQASVDPPLSPVSPVPPPSSIAVDATSGAGTTNSTTTTSVRPAVAASGASTTAKAPTRVTPVKAPSAKATPVKATAVPATPPPTVITIYLTTTTPTPTPTPTPAPAPPPSPSPSRAPPSTRPPVATSTPVGPPVAGRPCPTLGVEGTVEGGSNVFCQRDFATGTLAWRAVVNGGGCLSRQMTGIGVDGRRYACRPFGAGLDRWRPAH